MRACILTLAVALSAGWVAAAADMDETYTSLKQAVDQKNVEQVKTLSATLFELTKAAIAAPQPTGAEDKAAWTDAVNHAKEVQAFGEYALSALAFQGPPATTVDLLSTLEKQNPKSKYLDETYGLYLVALAQTGATAKVPAIAEKGLASFPENTDLLLAMANSSLERKNMNGALTYGRRLVAALNKRAKPETMDAADWEKKKGADLGRGYWIVGVICGDRNLYAEADRNLRAALPLIQGNTAELAPALYYLGVSNYQLGKMTLSKAKVLEGAKYSEQAAAIPGALQQQSYHNALVMKDEANKMR